jgi:hypothetical protein
VGDRFQFDSTVDGKAIKIASMIDEHTRESLLDRSYWWLGRGFWGLTCGFTGFGWCGV